MTRVARYLFTPADSPFNWLQEPEWLADAKFSYFVDEDDVLGVDEDFLDALRLPSSAAISVLSEAFFHASEPILNLIAKAQFLERSAEVVHGLNHVSWEQRRWLASANLMWAIGAKWLHMAKLKDEDLGIDDHLVYYARARALGHDHRIIKDHPNVRGVQTLGLLSFYLWVNGSINRAWSMVGIAIRHATGLGLHLKTIDSRLAPVQLEEMVNTWYSLYNLEVILSEILGRPTSTAVTDMTAHMAANQHETPHPSAGNAHAPQHRAVWEDFLRRTRSVTQTSGRGRMPWRNFSSIPDSSPWNHHFYYNRLCTISHLIERCVYGPEQQASRLEVQQRLRDLQRDLTAWEKSLPKELNLWSGGDGDTDPRVKISLALYHQSLKMTLYRSCLCEIDIPGQSRESQEFNMNSGQNCVHAAMSMMDILPELPTMHELVRLLPWWNLLHYLSQALSVFVLELCIDARHLHGSPNKLETCIVKAMSYLQCLASQSRSTYRAWRTFRLLLTLVNGRVPTLNIADIPSEIYMPPNWRPTDEVQLLTDLVGR
ncbi:hypothetical protein LTR20_002332 [Exophiala xenobiotica]|nr:hypothetical protein LTR20_002332 [Exophiala xenobiotica]KAK5513396.1 hypothetical protein LTR21_005847 [Exophiala xenobiotica]KAK5515343.1 hypothetical protein LTR07_007751 [Exophiala xenobiotica]